jgi:GNAT superfamily N-acetyltransferase
VELRRFEEIPELLHGTNPSFTPPFPGSVVKLIGPKSVFVQKHGEVHPLVATRGGKVVGRIAAIVNRSHNAHNGDTVGFFGFFDSINDQAVADELVHAASSILRKKGLHSIRGPYNPSINDDCGVLVEGNDRPSFVSMPWNPAYYADLLRAAGLPTVRTLYAWDVPLKKPIPERVDRIVERIKRRQSATIRTLDMKNLPREMGIIHRLYNETLDRNWGFYPIALDDLLHAADDLKAIADPNLIFFVCMEGREVGFSLALPNVNEVFHASRGRKGILRFLEMALRLQLQKIKSQRLCVLGVEPAYRDKGLSALLFHESFRAARERFELSEVSWVEANNEEILEGAGVMGGYRSRVYELFEKPLSA